MPWHLTKINIKGAMAERLALRHMKKQGLKRVDSNFAAPCGELDLIMLDANSLVFVEVRFRSKSRFGSAIESITSNKQKKVRKTAQLFLQYHPQHNHRQCRFDVVTVTYDDTSKHNCLEWVKGAF